MFQVRVNNLAKKLSENNLEGLIVSKPENIYYISGFSGEGIAIITGSQNYIITDFRYSEQAKHETSFEVVEIGSGVSHFSIAHNIIKELGLLTIGFERHSLTVKEYDNLISHFKNIKLLKTDGLIEELRIIKDENEITFIKNAQKITDKAFEHILGFIKPGESELDLVAELEYFMKKSGSKKVAFETILISGPKTSLPHGIPSERKLQYGDFVTIDFGARFNGYCSDMTRTIVIGKPSEQQQSIYNTVLRAQIKALELIKPGLKGKDIDYVARDYISEQGYGKNFGHGLGHGVGLEIHEEPRLSPKSESTLLPGMVVTVEPGIYIEKFGGVRIEDMIVLTENGCENLTHSEKRLICL
ncbi:MAG TPA: aminopeptidase P family protein [Thermoanaerobacterales bacterium]|uniref:M24 family metallopeptidase n=1 Tax=Tepidanaerobacter sp. GT38 TaxID=2722793 RepID=UPI0017E97199|nr:Xaa-Pro peptidase family protein [Tepidanaerobacter sp. GT38]MCG1013007.1 aminopeptidase P family protein [Tepidanaerobacter sp. GT38]HHY42016.1 aminopeptidase P family protein [Thermoanaerobacterales bacterium]